MGERHKHANEIIAYAEGKTVQYYDNQWRDWTHKCCPPFDKDMNWRIKPDEPVVRWLWAFKSRDSDGWFTPDFWFTEKDAKELNEKYKYQGMIKLEWSRTEFPSE